MLGQGKPCPLGGPQGFSRRRKGRLSPAHGQGGKWLLLRPSPWIVRMRWPHLQAWLTLQSLMSGQVDEDRTAGRRELERWARREKEPGIWGGSCPQPEGRGKCQQVGEPRPESRQDLPVKTPPPPPPTVH